MACDSMEFTVRPAPNQPARKESGRRTAAMRRGSPTFTLQLAWVTKSRVIELVKAKIPLSLRTSLASPSISRTGLQT